MHYNNLPLDYDVDDEEIMHPPPPIPPQPSSLDNEVARIEMEVQALPSYLISPSILNMLDELKILKEAIISYHEDEIAANEFYEYFESDLLPEELSSGLYQGDLFVDQPHLLDCAQYQWLRLRLDRTVYLTNLCLLSQKPSQTSTQSSGVNKVSKSKSTFQRVNKAVRCVKSAVNRLRKSSRQDNKPQVEFPRSGSVSSDESQDIQEDSASLRVRGTNNSGKTYTAQTHSNERISQYLSNLFIFIM
jgi:hypothetical protein